MHGILRSELRYKLRSSRDQVRVCAKRRIDTSASMRSVDVRTDCSVRSLRERRFCTNEIMRALSHRKRASRVRHTNALIRTCPQTRIAASGYLTPKSGRRSPSRRPRRSFRWDGTRCTTRCARVQYRRSASVAATWCRPRGSPRCSGSVGAESGESDRCRDAASSIAAGSKRAAYLNRQTSREATECAAASRRRTGATTWSSKRASIRVPVDADARSHAAGTSLPAAGATPGRAPRAEAHRYLRRTIQLLARRIPRRRVAAVHRSTKFVQARSTRTVGRSNSYPAAHRSPQTSEATARRSHEVLCGSPAQRQARSPGRVESEDRPQRAPDLA